MFVLCKSREHADNPVMRNRIVACSKLQGQLMQCQHQGTSPLMGGKAERGQWGVLVKGKGRRGQGSDSGIPKVTLQCSITGCLCSKDKVLQ